MKKIFIFVTTVCLLMVTLHAELTPVERGKINEQRAESLKTGVCYVHHQKFEEKSVRVGFGLVRPDRRYTAEEEITKFPFANQKANGGCVRNADDDINPTYVTVKFCPECVKAKEAVISAKQKMMDDQFEKHEVAEKTGICSIHNKQMTKVKAKKIFGEQSGDEPTSEELYGQFPFGSNVIEMGCVRDSEEAKTPVPQVWICEDCKRSRATWDRESKE